MRVLGSYALVLMVEGRGYYCDASNGRREWLPGDAVVVFPDVAHAYGPSQNREWTQIYYVFAGPQFDLWRSQGLLSPDRPVLRIGSVDYWRQRLCEIVRGEPLHGAGAGLRAMGRFLHVVAEMLATDAEASQRSSRERWLEKSLRLLGDRSASGWMEPGEVARQVGLSYENFRKRFAQLSGESPGHFQKRRRLEWACAAIYHGELSFKQIADELGFCDVFHFSKAFKQEIGVTPSEYRLRVRGR
ncbi:MAG TPA: AraC family transcriptional regulator [Opitutaceae bacterium]